MIDEYSDKNF